MLGLSNQWHKLPRLAAAVLAALLCVASTQPAEAVIVDRLIAPGDATPVNITAPTDDPGWYNVPENRSAVYLGNQWVLDATHAGVGDVVLDGETYQLIPNSRVILSNPSGGGHSADSDIALYRINTNSSGLTPENASTNIKPITLSTSNLSLGTEVLMIGRSINRVVNTSDPLGHQDYSVEGQAVHGLGTTNSGATKTWGTNKVSTASEIASGANLTLTVSVGSAARTVVTQVTRFDTDDYNAPGVTTNNATDNEAQAASGDSGGPVFFKSGNEWKLAGVMHAIFVQRNGFATFDDHTVFSSLGTFTYRNQINNLLADNNYSIMGDVDLDGNVDADDLTALADGWRHSQAAGDIVSWKKGDLNQNGLTDLADFALLRQALGGTVSTSDLQSLITVAGTAVPEPTTAFLAAMGLFFLALRRRR